MDHHGMFIYININYHDFYHDLWTSYKIWEPKNTNANILCT
jgi:hypothetical protein